MNKLINHHFIRRRVLRFIEFSKKTLFWIRFIFAATLIVPKITVCVTSQW